MPEAGLVSISDGALTARINALGAELSSLTDATGREYMNPADPAFWTGRAPLLFPIVGALCGGRYRLGDRDYALPKHGFARTSRFELAGHEPAMARFRLADSEATRAAFPFAFTLDAEFTLAAQTLSMAVMVTNSGDVAMPFSFGFHPAFAWPLPGGGRKEAHRIVFEHEESAPIRRINAATLTLLATPEASPVTGRVLAPESMMFERDALIWDRLESRSLTFAGEQGAALEIAFPDTPHLAIWQKPGAPFLAIEPWQGFNDPQGFVGDFRDKPGVVALPPGEPRRFRMEVTVRPG